MKRILAFILATIMNISTLPMVDGTVAPQSNTNTANDEYVSLPITIRDYAADGMLFEWNDLGEDKDFTRPKSGSSEWITKTYSYVNENNVWQANSQTCIYTAGKNPATARDWYCIVCNADGSVARIIGIGTNKDFTGSNALGNGQFAILVYKNATNYSALSSITDSTKDGYIISYNRSYKTITVKQKNYDTYHSRNTKGYGLTATDGASKFNDLNIAGTELVENGKWGVKDVTPTTNKLNSGALQTLYGCYVRTNLVKGDLGADGKPVYTDATVTYLANYMMKTLQEAYKGSDGAYQMWYVMGTKLFDNNNNYVGNNSNATRDMAEVFRRCIPKNALGSLDATRAKNITQAKDCRTYYDAAYFLLQNLYTDNSGYGQKVAEYHQINLVKKDGYYVYNSAYNDSVYDTTKGVIYNSQTDQIATRSGTYVRGNLQPETCFNPINGSYYGNNGNKYTEIFSPTSTDNTHYYANTNYNMTLEGHAQFVYYQDDSLYFNFTGDDDVYLFINGKKVLDMGGAHAISKCGIKLNDVRELCGLKDGQVYNFDFYYMERHGTAANFGIETNIKIVDPSMLTEKLAYQDGVSVGNYGYVDPYKPITYQFKLTNNGDAKIEELTFKDDNLNVYLNKDNINLNGETTISNLYAAVTDKDGKVKESYAAGKLTVPALKKMLENGLDVGDTISIAGIRYTVPVSKWADNKFTNTVNTTAISRGENASHRTLNGLASCTVQKQQYQYDGIHYYEWMGKSVTATKAELMQPIYDAGVKNPTGKIQLCSPSGRTDGAGINDHAQVTANGITYKGTKTGADTYYYKVGNYGPVAVTVYSYDVADNIYVLDYSLPVELNDSEHGLLVNDTLSLAENKHPTTATTRGIVEGCNTSNYGEFEYSGSGTTSLKYTLEKFMNGVDQVKISVMVMEDGAKELTNKTGVMMEETVSVVPANVVYYEDDFTGITYIGKDGNKWTQEGTNNGTQSADQNSPYGSDPNYSEDTLLSDVDNDDASNGTLSSITVATTADVMSFEFRGTGFEILSRTTQDKYAIVSVKVERKSDGAIVKQYPVITESKGGDLYQVPIISVTDLAWGDYKVTLRAVGSSEKKTRVLYIDGIRIYHPLADVDEVRYYNPDEAHAEFDEIKSLIGGGNALYIDVDEELGLKMVTGTTAIESQEYGSFPVTTITEEDGGLDMYLELGPNNELYLDGHDGNSFLALYLYPDSKYTDNERTIQIGAHRKSSYTLADTSVVNLIYGSTVEDCVNGVVGVNGYTINSGTEQYYVIDPDNLVYDEANGRYLLLIGTNDSDDEYAALALTKLKISGYTVGTIEKEVADAAEENVIESSPALMEAKALQNHYKSLVPQEPDESEEPEINENLVITSASLKSAKVASGKIATLGVKCSDDAATLVVLDADNNKVEFKKSASSVKNGVTSFTATWTVTGSRGDELNYTVVVYDSNGLRSSNTMPITVTIK